jgi:hypothetical protein
MPRSRKYPDAIDVEATEKPKRRKRRKRRKDAKRTGSEAAPSAKRRKARMDRSEAVQEPEKVRTWLRSGWCQEAHATASPVAHHGRCKFVTETPASIAVCPCLCHVPGALDLLDATLKAAAPKPSKKKVVKVPQGQCPKCGELARKVIKNEKRFWKCPNGHRWPRS